MPNAARLSGVGTFYAFEFDDNTKTSFSVSAGSTSFSNEFDENTSTTISGTQKMSATSGGGLIVLDSINEVDSFDNILTSNLELHLDATSGFMRLQQSFLSTGTTTFTVPTGVTQVSAVCVGGGGGGAGSGGDENSAGGGGGLSYGTFTVTPGETLTVTVGTGGAGGTGNPPLGQNGNGGAGGNTTIARGSTILLNGGGGQGGIEDDDLSLGGVGGTSTGTERDGGGTGGRGGGPFNNSAAGGGGAAGYSGNGGAGSGNPLSSGSAGAGGGGGGGNARGENDNFNGQGGGGVGILGQGNNGAAGGGGGSDGGDARGLNEVTGGLFGGGGGGANEESTDNGSAGSRGAARIIWGSGRSYPSTNTSDQYSWKDISSNNRHSRISVGWDPYVSKTSGASSGNNVFSLLEFDSTIQVGQSVVIPEIQAISGVGTFTYELYNASGLVELSTSGNISYNSVTQSPLVGPIGETIGTREFFKFGGSNFQSIQNTTLRIPPQQVPYNAIKLAHILDGTTIFPALSSSIDNERASVLNVPFESSASRLGVCDGTGGSAYTGVTGTAARTIIVGVKFPASPASSYTAFSYGSNATGQRFNIRLMSTGQIRITFGNSYVQIPTTAIDDLKDFQLIAVTVPASGTVSDVRVWLNGNEVTSQLTVFGGTTAINTSSANNVTIGGGSHGTVEYLDDSVITKVMIYSSVLSDLEIKQIYQSIIPDIYPFVERAS